MNLSLHTSISNTVDLNEQHAQKEDKDLIIACIKNDRLAQASLYKKHYGVMMSICMRYTKNRDEALEIVNNGFLKVFLNLNKWQGGSLQGWIRRIITNTAIDQLRAQVKYKEQSLPDDYDVYIADDYTSKLETNDLMNLVNALPDEQRMVFNLFAIEGYKHKEIADLLHISEGTSKWYVSEARKTLKLRIEKHYKL
jgi:RNA polymerase sigma factor (sigma-70 family)